MKAYAVLWRRKSGTWDFAGVYTHEHQANAQSNVCYDMEPESRSVVREVDCQVNLYTAGQSPTWHMAIHAEV